MKAILKDDIIIRLGVGDTEVGRVPPGAGLERLRWNGKQVVDLAKQDSFWVRRIPSGYELHVVEVDGSQQVSMSYTDRYNLTTDADGTIRVKTESEVLQEKAQEEKQMLKTRVRARIRERVGDLEDRVADLQKLVYVLMAALVEKDSDAQSLVQNIFQSIRDTYPTEKLESLSSRLSTLKDILSTYYKS